MLKFLEIAWGLDASCGEADYEMEAACAQGQLFLDQGQSGFKKRKVELFQEEIERLVQSRVLTTDAEVFLHALSSGFLPSRVVPAAYKRLKDDGVLQYSNSQRPRCSADAIKEPRKLEVTRGG